MADQPLTLAVFEEFQRKIFERFDSVGSRFDAVDARLFVMWQLGLVGE